MINIAVAADKALVKSSGNQLIKRKMKHVDIGLLVSILILLSLGLMMVLSASAPSALTYNGDSYYYFKSQAQNALLGLIAMVALSFVDYRIYKGRIADLLMIVAFCLLGLVLVPGVGVTVNEATRWLKIGVQFQPSEVMKIALIIFMASKIAKKPDKIKKFATGLLPYLALLGIIALLLLLEPHMSAAVIMLVIGAAILFTAGAEWIHIIPMGAIGLVAGFILAKAAPYRWRRVLIFMDPWQDKLRRWLADYSVLVCDWFWWVIWSRSWQKHTKIYVHSRTA